jgi:beta-N-acetylhexosaminidase
MHPGPILIGLPGTELDEAGRQQLRHPAVGGVVLFARNFSDAEQLDALVADIRAARDPRLLVAIDQEGGRVQRLQEGFTRLPPLGVLGRLHADDSRKALDMAYRHGRVMATEMLAAGIDLSFAPVLDLDRGSSVIGDRALSPDPAVVVALGGAYVAGMHDAGMRATGKHFPGHGSVVADSHIADVIDERPLEELFAEDLMPFRDLAAQLDAIMMAHVTYTQVDPQPAGYSQTWIRDILRGQLAYRGVIISDDLGMHAALSAGPLVERVEHCLQAGCDLVLVCQPEDVAELLAGWDGAPASTAVSRLYGRPTVNRRELEEVNAEGIREWRHWQRTVAALGEQSWT